MLHAAHSSKRKRCARKEVLRKSVAARVRAATVCVFGITIGSESRATHTTRSAVVAAHREAAAFCALRKEENQKEPAPGMQMVAEWHIR